MTHLTLEMAGSRDVVWLDPFLIAGKKVRRLAAVKPAEKKNQKDVRSFHEKVVGTKAEVETNGIAAPTTLEVLNMHRQVS
jgi:hypothetical protein